MATLRNTSVPADFIQRSIRKFHIVVVPEVKETNQTT